MEKRIASLILVVFMMGSSVGRADFKYSESSKLTGGMMAGMMKFAGAFSKQAREPIVTTHYVKGNRLRTEHSDGKVQIIDLDGRRIIDLNSQNRTYSVVTFDDMRAALQKMQENMNKQGANMKIVPKVEVTPTNNSRLIQGQSARETKVRIEMQMQAEDPKQQQQAQSFSFLVTSDMWLAPEVKGYQEVQKFHERMAKELNWVPGAMFGGNPQMSNGMMELQKNAATMNGLPLLQYSSIGMAGMPQTATGGARPAVEGGKETTSTTGETATSKSTTSEGGTSSVTRPGEVLTKGIGGLIGGFGKRKKKQEQAEPQSTETQETRTAETAPAESRAAGASGGASLADMTIEVTSFSTDPLDATLFEVPAGYTHVQESADQVLGGRRR